MFELIPQVVASLVFSNVCETCEKPLSPKNSWGVCDDCQKSIPSIKTPFCGICGRPMAQEWPTCSDCKDRAKTLHFDRALSTALYAGTIKSLLHAFKFENRKALKQYLSHRLLACLNEHNTLFCFNAIVAVPADPDRQMVRGYNPALLLAGALAKARRVTNLSNYLIKERTGSAQSLLSKQQRLENVLGCFKTVPGPWFKDRRVLLVDDILTTGATASECARALKTAGALSVQTITVARGL